MERTYLNFRARARSCKSKEVTGDKPEKQRRTKGKTRRIVGLVQMEFSFKPYTNSVMFLTLDG
jgi:hypothetical protein